MSKTRKFYILVAVAMPIAVVAVILAWLGDNLRTVILFSIVSVSWSIKVFTKTRKLSKHQEADQIHHTAKKILRHRHMVIFERTFWLFVLVSGIVGLIVGVIRDKAAYLILEALWFIVVGGVHLLFVSILTDEFSSLIREGGKANR